MRVQTPQIVPNFLDESGGGKRGHAISHLTSVKKRGGASPAWLYKYTTLADSGEIGYEIPRRKRGGGQGEAAEGEEEEGSGREPEQHERLFSRFNTLRATAALRTFPSRLLAWQTTSAPPPPPSSPHRHTQVTRAKSTFGSGGGMGCLAAYCDVVFRAVKVRLVNKAASKHFCCT